MALALAALVAACASTPPPPPAPGAPPPLMRFEPLGQPRATIVALHGFNDRKAAFLAFGDRASRAGVRVLAYDQPGFGASRDRGRWPGTEALVAALHVMIDDARRSAPDAPVVVLGASMGAAVAITALARPDAPPVDGVVLVAPAAWGGDQLNPILRASLWLTASIAPELELSAGGLAVRTSDNTPMLRALARDPLYLPTATAANVQGLVRLMDEALAAAPGLAGRRLVLIGARDEVVPPAAFEVLLEQLAGPACTLVRYAEGWHLLLRDHQRERVFADVLAWLDDRPPRAGDVRRCAAAVVAQAPD